MRGNLRVPPAPSSVRPAAMHGLLAQLTERLRDALASLQHRFEEVAVALDSLERLAHAEVARPYLLAELLPAQRRRDRCPWFRAHRVGGGDRLAVPVLAMVYEHTAALLLQPL